MYGWKVFTMTSLKVSQKVAAAVTPAKAGVQTLSRRRQGTMNNKLDYEH